MRALVRLNATADSVVSFITELEVYGNKIVDEDGLPDIVISDDPIFFLTQATAGQKFFIHQPSSPRNIAIGVTCFTPNEMLERITGKRS